MKEYIIYSKVKDKNGKPITLYLEDLDGLAAEFRKKENRCFHPEIFKFPTINSAIIWWRSHYEWTSHQCGIHASATKYDPNPVIEIGEIIDGYLNSVKPVHRLDLKNGASPLNEPDKNTMTEEEKKDYECCIDAETVVRGALLAITEEARAAEARRKENDLIEPFIIYNPIEKEPEISNEKRR